MATQNNEDTWQRYMAAHGSPAEYAAGGWDMARILGDLRAQWHELSGPELGEVANQIAGYLELHGYPLAHENEPAVDTHFEYQPWPGNKSVCRLRLYERGAARIVVATEKPGNEGMSITNAAEGLANAVCARYGIRPGRLVWIEHYLRHRAYGWEEREEQDQASTFDLVTFDYDPQSRRLTDPDWIRLTRAAAESLTGDVLDDES